MPLHQTDGTKSNSVDSALTIHGFSPEEDYGKIDVIRYLPLDRFLALLELEAMWFSRLGALQDKFECTTPGGFRAQFLHLEANADAVEKCKAMGLWDTMKSVAENDRTGDAGRGMLLVNCWFIGKLESAEMWRQYGDGGKGIAIRSTVKQLSTVFQIPGLYRLPSAVGCVKYVDFKTYRLGKEDRGRVAFLKDKATYETENEVRVVTLNNFHLGCLNPDGSQAGLPGSAVFCPEIKGLYIKCDLKGLIRSVIVGPNSHANFRMLVKRIVARYGLTIEVEYSKLPPLCGI